MAQNGISRTMLRMRSRDEREVLRQGRGRSKDLMNDGQATGDQRAYRRASASSCSFALAARRPCERAVSASTDMGKSAHTVPSDRQPTPIQSRRL